MNKIKLTFEVYYTNSNKQPDMTWTIIFNPAYYTFLYLNSSLYSFFIPYNKYLEYKQTKDPSIFTHTNCDIFNDKNGLDGSSDVITYKCINAEFI